MTRPAARFTQADVARILRGADQARVPVAVDFLPDGTIRAYVNYGDTVKIEPKPEDEASEPAQELDL